MTDRGSRESSQSVDWIYGVACLLGAGMFLVAPWAWYINRWNGTGLCDQIDGASPAERAVFDTSIFIFLLFLTWVFVTWRVRLRTSRDQRVDGGLALVILGALELVAMIGVLALTSS